jgi:hypothetical protein
MKAKKFLKIVKRLCCDENCESGNCPMVVKKKNYSTCLMLAAEESPGNWKVKKIIKAVKKAEKAKHKKWVIRV